MFCAKICFIFFIKNFIKNNYIHLLTCIVVWRSLVVSGTACRKSTVRFSAGHPIADSLLGFTNVEDNGAILCTLYIGALPVRSPTTK